MTLQEKIEYIGIDKFVKFTNTDDFPQLSNTLRIFLKDIGIYSNRKGYPYLTTDGKLKQFNDTLIQIGEGIVNDPFCIDIAGNERIVGYDLKDEAIDIINTSIEKYIECLYALRYYTNEIEGKEEAILIYEDNQSTIKTASEEIYNERSKHIDVEYHFIREKIRNNQNGISVKKIVRK